MVELVKRVYHFCIAVAANLWFGFPGRELTVIGVTGTDGKTTTTTMIYEILKRAKIKTSMITSVHAVIAGKSYDTGFHVTTPTSWSVQQYLRDAVKHGDTHVVLEVTSHALGQSRVLGIPFAVGVITNVTHEHLDWHGTFEHYLATKLSLLKRSRVAIVNRDEADLFAASLPIIKNKRYVTYGIRRDSMVNPSNHPFKILLPGEFNRYNALAAISTAEVLGIKPSVWKKTFATFKGVVGRMEVVATKPFKVIVDFAHTPNALDNALKTVRKMTKKRVIHVFGSAGLRDSTKRPMMGAASAAHADISIITEEDYRTEDVEKIMDQIASGIPDGKTVYRFPIRKDAVKFALKSATKGDIVIITGKGHEKSLCRGTVEYPWSDQKEVKKMLQSIMRYAS